MLVPNLILAGADFFIDASQFIQNGVLNMTKLLHQLRFQVIIGIDAELISKTHPSSAVNCNYDLLVLFHLSLNS